MNLAFFLLILFAPPRTIDWVFILGSARAQTKRLKKKVTTYLLRRQTILIRPLNFIYLYNIFHVKALDFFFIIPGH